MDVLVTLKYTTVFNSNIVSLPLGFSRENGCRCWPTLSTSTIDGCVLLRPDVRVCMWYLVCKCPTANTIIPFTLFFARLSIAFHIFYFFSYQIGFAICGSSPIARVSISRYFWIDELNKYNWKTKTKKMAMVKSSEVDRVDANSQQWMMMILASQQIVSISSIYK